MIYRNPLTTEHRCAVATGTNAEISIGGVPGVHYAIGQIIASYNADITGTLSVVQGGETIFSTSIVSAGPAPLIFDPMFPLESDEDATIVLAGSPNVVGSLFALIGRV